MGWLDANLQRDSLSQRFKSTDNDTPESKKRSDTGRMSPTLICLPSACAALS